MNESFKKLVSSMLDACDTLEKYHPNNNISLRKLAESDLLNFLLYDCKIYSLTRCYVLEEFQFNVKLNVALSMVIEFDENLV